MDTTTTAPARTLVPWYIDEHSGRFDIHSPDRNLVATVGFNPNIPKGDTHYRERLFLAQFIVTACNNYEDLLAACKEALDNLRADDEPVVRAMLSDAIAKADPNWLQPCDIPF